MPPIQTPNDSGSQYNVDYLNQISVTPTAKSFFSKKQLIILGGLGVLVIIALIASFAFTSKPKTLSRVAVRLTTSQTIVDDAQKKLKDSSLRGLNSSLSIYIKNATRDLASVYSVPKDATKSTVSADNTTELVAKLEDARLNAVFDRVYAREIAYHLQVTINLLNQAYKGTSNEEIRSYITTTLDNLVPTQKAFSDFQDKNS